MKGLPLNPKTKKSWIRLCHLFSSLSCVILFPDNKLHVDQELVIHYTFADRTNVQNGVMGDVLDIRASYSFRCTDIDLSISTSTDQFYLSTSSAGYIKCHHGGNKCSILQAEAPITEINLLRSDS